MNRCLALDLDGTLIDSVPDLLASANRVMACRSLAPFARAEVVPMIGDGARILVRRLMAARGIEAQPADLAAFMDDYLAHAADLTTPYPGVPETLERLARDGWTLVVCTNKPGAAARDVLPRLGLLPHFAAVGAGDTYPMQKPDPAHLLATLADAGADRARTVMVGDHHNDMAAAAGADIPALFATWGYGPPSMAGAAPLVGAFADIPGAASALVG